MQEEVTANEATYCVLSRKCEKQPVVRRSDDFPQHIYIYTVSNMSHICMFVSLCVHNRVTMGKGSGGHPSLSPDSERALEREAKQFAGILGKHVSHLRPVPGVKEVGVWTVLKATVGEQETAHETLDLCREGGGGGGGGKRQLARRCSPFGVTVGPGM